MKILILCTGNSCRSQMAHGILQSFDKNLQVNSAGTNPATQVHPKAIQAMAEIGLNISRHSPQKIDRFLSDTWDYVITVCGGANETCPAFTGIVKKRIHMGFEDPAEAKGTEEEIMDEFRKIRNQILVDFFTFTNKNLRN